MDKIVNLKNIDFNSELGLKIQWLSDCVKNKNNLSYSSFVFFHHKTSKLYYIDLDLLNEEMDKYPVYCLKENNIHFLNPGSKINKIPFWESYFDEEGNRINYISSMENFKIPINNFNLVSKLDTKDLLWIFGENLEYIYNELYYEPCTIQKIDPVSKSIHLEFLGINGEKKKRKINVLQAEYRYFKKCSTIQHLNDSNPEWHNKKYSELIKKRIQEMKEKEKITEVLDKKSYSNISDSYPLKINSYNWSINIA